MKWPWAIMIGLSVYAAAGEGLVLYTEDSPPNNYLAADGKTVIGTATERVVAAMKRADVAYTIVLTNWSRALNLTKQQANGCVYSTARLPERQHLFVWVGKVADTSWYLWGRPGTNKPGSLSDVRNKVVCDLLGDAPGRYLIASGQRLVSSESHEICARNVLRGFADYWATSLRAGTAELARLGLSGQLVPKLQFHQTDLFLACNPAVPAPVIDRLHQALDALQPQKVQ